MIRWVWMMKPQDRLEQVAALPFRRAATGGVDILLITSRSSGRWIIPKGWLAKGSKPRHCAAREAYEEAGLRGRVGKSALGEFEYVKRLGRSAAPCRVRVFPLETTAEKRKWPEMHQRARAWFSPVEAATLVSDPGLGAIVLELAARHGRRARGGRGARNAPAKNRESRSSCG